MRFSLRLLLPLALVLAALAWLVVPLVDRLTLGWFVRDLEVRSRVLASTMNEPLQGMLAGGQSGRIQPYFERISLDERLFALGLCDASGKVVARTATLPGSIQCDSPGARVLEFERGDLHVATFPVEGEGGAAARLVLVHDMSFAKGRSAETRKYVFYLFATIAAVVSLVTLVVLHLSVRGLIAGLQALIRGEGLALGAQEAPELRPVARDLRRLIRDLEADRVRDESQVTWNASTLREILRDDLRGDDVLIVSNREPYIHQRVAGKIEVLRPASGLVTALEPVMRACSGTWIAHGAGSADRETVDEDDRVAVPPEKPAYRIRRLWLSKEEEAGYYYGFANEGLWPLCHIAHARPMFRSQDWNQYKAVNRKFAEAVVREARSEDPIVLVQDYHLALLPRMIRERLPRATIITFWHIPWPNPETFGICPWREELIEGLLGSSILGFHTQFHCNNFLDTVDRLLEARVDRETFSISFGGQETSVARYPISIEWPPIGLDAVAATAECRRAVREREGLPADALIAIGVDRLDYTKGIVERLMAVERLLELHPEWIGRLVMIQVAAPSRSSIDEYQNLEARVRALAARINKRFAQGNYAPILLKIEHHAKEDVFTYFRAAEVCVVSSLHDGMNLVAKEFVATRDDEQGVLVLSQFTGAARELPEALIVNPYNLDQCAGALHHALTMPATEQRDRMRSMRSVVQEFNVFRWAGRMLLDAARMRRRERLLSRAKAPAGAKVRRLR